VPERQVKISLESVSRLVDRYDDGWEYSFSFIDRSEGATKKKRNENGLGIGRGNVCSKGGCSSAFWVGLEYVKLNLLKP